MSVYWGASGAGTDAEIIDRLRVELETVRRERDALKAQLERAAVWIAEALAKP